MEYKKFDTPTVIYADGSIVEMAPENGKAFTLDELQGIVGGNVQLIELPNKLQLWMNEEGKLDDLPFNHMATILWRVLWYGYDMGSDDFMVGNVLICEPKFTQDDE